MVEGRLEPWALKAVADESLERAASQLRDIVKELVDRLHPFPAFVGMTSIQAVEVEPRGLQATNKGCIVVCPDGELYELNLQTIPGPLGVSDVDHVDEYRPLELPLEEYIPYAYAAIRALTEKLNAP